MTAGTDEDVITTAHESLKITHDRIDGNRLARLIEHPTISRDTLDGSTDTHTGHDVHKLLRLVDTHVLHEVDEAPHHQTAT